MECIWETGASSIRAQREANLELGDRLAISLRSWWACPPCRRQSSLIDIVRLPVRPLAITTRIRPVLTLPLKRHLLAK